MSAMSQRLLYALRLLDEWQACFLCFLAGAGLAVGFAPYDAWYLAPIAISLFYILLDAAAGRRHALYRGFSFGYGFFIAGTYWIAYALAVDAEKFGWLIPISVLGLSAVMALWFALFGWLVWWRRTGQGMSDILRFLALWVVVEYLRSLGIFGFPWNLAGYLALNSERVVQLGSIVGVYGLSILMVAVSLLPTVWIRQGIGEQARTIYSATVLIALIVAYGFGMARMPERAEMSALRVRVVQPNIPQSLKWTQEGRLDSLRIHAQLSQLQTDDPRPEIVIWSETALPFTIYPDSVWPSRLSQILPPHGMLLSGAVRADDRGKAIQLWNSVIVTDGAGALRGSYDKHQLVPFGEFVPLRHVLPLEKITPGDTDFSRGPGPQTLHVEGVPAFSPLVCYEAIFPWIAVDATDRPDWLLNVTNDAWYGDSPGPYQHFAMSRMRSIEQGLPLVRAANTGISGVVDPYGRVVRSLPLNVRGIVDQALPLPLAPPLYAHYGDWLVGILLLGIWLLGYIPLSIRKN